MFLENGGRREELYRNVNIALSWPTPINSVRHLGLSDGTNDPRNGDNLLWNSTRYIFLWQLFVVIHHNLTASKPKYILSIITEVVKKQYFISGSYVSLDTQTKACSYSLDYFGHIKKTWGWSWGKTPYGQWENSCPQTPLQDVVQRESKEHISMRERKQSTSLRSLKTGLWK